MNTTIGSALALILLVILPAAGRTYVKSYVEFIHYVERLHQSILASPGHTAEPQGAHPH